MRRLVPALVAATVLGLPAGAAAAPTPGASYGGGTFPPSLKDAKDSAVVGATVAADGQAVRVVANVALDCGKGGLATQQLAATGRIGPDGRLRFDARTRKYEFNIAGAKPRGTATVDLGFEDATASGTIRMITRRRGSACDATLPVQLRRATPDTSPPAAPVAGALYFGNGSAVYREAGVPVALRVGASGRRVAIAMVGAPVRCRKVTDYLVNYSPPMRIRSGGRFSRRERFVTRFKGGASNRTRFKLRGRFTEQGARGTYSATMVVKVPGRRDVRCKTGTIRWTAVR